MKQWILGLMLGMAVLATAAPTQAAAITPQGKSFGIGLLLGSPLGVSGKYKISGNTALAFGVGGFSGYANAINIHVDHLWHPWVPINNRDLSLPVYAGVGAIVALSASDPAIPGQRVTYGAPGWLGVRGPFGIAMAFKRAPIDLFAELAPTLTVGNWATVGIDGSVGVRLYF